MTPAQDFNGPAVITVTANDGTEDSNNQSFTLTVTPVNDAPVLVSIADQSTVEDTPLTVTLSATDVDGDSLTYSAVSSTENITVSILGSVLTLSPASNFNGTGIINVTASDGTVSSNTVTFTVTVTSANDVPVLAAIADQITDEDQSMSVSLSATDEDGDNITYTAVSDTSAISTFITGSVLTMTPAQDFNGSAVITVTANDGTGNSSPESFILTVSPVNDAPVLDAIPNQTTNEDTPLYVILSAYDVDGDSITFNPISFSSNIGVSVEDSILMLTPSDDFNGNGIIIVTASDGTLSSNTVTFTLIVTPVNDAPVITPISPQMILEDQSLTLSLSSTDNDGDNVTYSAESSTESVTVFVIGSSLNLIPNENFNEQATISVTATDGTDYSSVESFILTIISVNDAPVLSAIPNQTTNEDTPLTVTLSATDVDGDSLTFSAVSTTENIIASIVDSNLTLRPETNFNGNGIIIISANDGTEGSNTVTFTLTVIPVNDAPVLADIPDQVIIEDQTSSISLSATDIDGDNIIYSVESDTASVTVILNGNIMTFIPDEHFNGTTVITAIASDGTEYSNTVAFNLTFSAVNDAPGDFGGAA